MAIADITKPMALDETLQATNGKMDTVVTKLQGIIDALGVDTSVYKAAGNKTCAELVPALLVASNLGNVYNITDSGTTTSDFVDGSGKPIHIGDNVAVVDVGTGGSNVFKFDLLAGMVDLTNYVQKSSTAGLLKNDGSVDSTAYAKQSEMSVTDGTGADVDKTTIQLKSGTTATVLKTHQDISGKADKVSDATNGNLAGLDASGNLTDSGVAKTDIDAMQDELSTDYAEVTGNPINFSTLSAQDAKSTILSVEPIQDLHGFSKPWVGGVGKNKISSVIDYTDGNVHQYFGTEHITLGAGTYTASYYNESSKASKLFVTKFVSGTGSTIGNATIPANSRGFSTFTLTESSEIAIQGRFDPAETITSLSVFTRFQMETGSIMTNYEPYENICPISGRTEIGTLGVGGNLIEGIENGSWNLSQQSKVLDNARARSTKLIRIEPSTQYCISAKSSGGKTIQTIAQFYSGIGSGTFISETSGWEDVSRSFTTPENCKYIAIIFRTSNNDHYPENYMSEVQVEKGSATDYSPYTESTNLTISFGQTVYGCHYSLENGVLVVDRGIVDLSTLTFTQVGNLNLQYTQDITNIKYTPDNLTLGNGLSENYEMHIGSGMGATVGCIAIDIDKVSVNMGYLPYQPTGKFVYELATPITIQLTPNEISLLEGVNNISVDDDFTSITLTYRDGSVATLNDVKVAKENLEQAIADSQILTDTVTGDKYRLVVTNGVLSVEQISN